jgi:hypothetical protein
LSKDIRLLSPDHPGTPAGFLEDSDPGIGEEVPTGETAPLLLGNDETASDQGRKLALRDEVDERSAHHVERSNLVGGQRAGHRIAKIMA